MEVTFRKIFIPFRVVYLVILFVRLHWLVAYLLLVAILYYNIRFIVQCKRAHESVGRVLGQALLTQDMTHTYCIGYNFKSIS